MPKIDTNTVDVIIEIRGGLVAAVYAPENVQCYVIDHDCEPDSAEPESDETCPATWTPVYLLDKAPAEVRAAVATWTTNETEEG